MPKRTRPSTQFNEWQRQLNHQCAVVLATVLRESDLDIDALAVRSGIPVAQIKKHVLAWHDGNAWSHRVFGFDVLFALLHAAGFDLYVAPVPAEQVAESARDLAA